MKRLTLFIVLLMPLLASGAEITANCTLPDRTPVTIELDVRGHNVSSPRISWNGDRFTPTATSKGWSSRSSYGTNEVTTYRVLVSGNGTMNVISIPADFLQSRASVFVMAGDRTQTLPLSCTYEGLEQLIAMNYYPEVRGDERGIEERNRYRPSAREVYSRGARRY